MKIHLTKTYSLGTGLRCTNSPFTRGRIVSETEFETKLKTNPDSVCKRCLDLGIQDRVAKRTIQAYG